MNLKFSVTLVRVEFSQFSLHRIEFGSSSTKSKMFQ